MSRAQLMLEAHSMTSTYIVVAKPGTMRADKNGSRPIERELERQGFEVWCPVQTEKRKQRGKVVLYDRLMLERYLFARGRKPHKARDCPSVSHVLLRGSQYATVSEPELVPLMGWQQAKPISKLTKDFPRGCLVRVKSGLFEGYHGKVRWAREAAQTVFVSLHNGPAKALEIDAVHLERA